MANVCIVHEPAIADTAEAFARKLKKKGDEVTLLCRDRFPIADRMFSFLSMLSSKFDETFIIISGTENSILSTWISRELLVQQSLGNFHNIYPAFPTVNEIQSQWKEYKHIVVL